VNIPTVLVIDGGCLGPGMLKALNSRDLTAVAINVQDLALDESGQAPKWIHLVPAGLVVGRDGREWLNDNPQLVLDAFAAGAVDLPLDMEHATELRAPQGEPAPAVGWIQELQIRDGQIWGRVDWTEAGRNAVESKSYRYVSPVFVFERASKRVVALTSAGLTNRPNLFLQALNGQEKNMELKKLLAALGLPETASFDEAMAHLGKLKGDLATATNAAANPSLDKFVPRADYNAALARATNAEKSLADQAEKAKEKDITAAIDKALAEGKITPATVEYHKAQCAQEGGLERFAEFVKAAPVVGDPSSMDKKRPEEKGKALNAEEQCIAEMFGNSVEDLQKYGKE
jgi:phage I-like protein